MRWMLVIYLTGGWHILADSINPFPDKASCYEALHEAQKKPDNLFMAFCRPERNDEKQ